jgi:hypothetical protein
MISTTREAAILVPDGPCGNFGQAEMPSGKGVMEHV